MPNDTEVQRFLEELDHPLKSEILQIRALFLAADSSITEGIKWNSMSFRTTEWFATLNKRATDRIEFVLHLGAKVKAEANITTIQDPDGLLNWLAKDRCLLVIHDAGDFRRKNRALKNVIREWITHLG